MDKSTVDIVIPCYNTGRYLRQAINSALAQTYPHINVLVVDDGSIDDTKEIVESHRGRVDYYYQENKGLPAARNAGISLTHGDFVCLLDADDVIMPHMIQDQVEEFDQDAGVDITHGKTLAFDNDDIEHPCAETWRPQRSWEDYVEPLSVICAVHLGSSLIRRSCFERFGLFTQELAEQGCEDWAFWLHCAIHGASFRHVPRVHGLYRQHAGSMSSSELAIARRESELIKLAAGMFDLCRVKETRRLKVLSCGIRSIAARWLPLGEPEKFQELLELSNSVLAVSGQDLQMADTFPYSAETPPALITLALSKEFFDLKLEELAIVMFLKCGDIRTLKDDCNRRRQSILFEVVVASVAAAVSANKLQRLSEPYEIPGAPVGAKPASPLQETTDYYFHLERIVPQHASFQGYVKHQLGLLEESRGHMDRAEIDMRDSISLNPNCSYAYVDLGRVLQTKGDLEGAEKALRTSIELNPNFSFAHHVLGIVLENKMDYEGAEAELKIAVELNPDSSFAHCDLSRILDVKGDYVGAEQALSNCLTLDPDFALGRLEHAKVFAKMGRYGKAVREFLKASRTDPGFSRDYLIGGLKSIFRKRLPRNRSQPKRP